MEVEHGLVGQCFCGEGFCHISHRGKGVPSSSGFVGSVYRSEGVGVDPVYYVAEVFALDVIRDSDE